MKWFPLFGLAAALVVLEGPAAVLHADDDNDDDRPRHSRYRDEAPWRDVREREKGHGPIHRRLFRLPLGMELQFDSPHGDRWRDRGLEGRDRHDSRRYRSPWYRVDPETWYEDDRERRHGRHRPHRGYDEDAVEDLTDDLLDEIEDLRDEAELDDRNYRPVRRLRERLERLEEVTKHLEKAADDDDRAGEVRWRYRRFQDHWFGIVSDLQSFGIRGDWPEPAREIYRLNDRLQRQLYRSGPHWGPPVYGRPHYGPYRNPPSYDGWR